MFAAFLRCRQVIAAEDKGGFLGIDYSRGPTKTFVIKSRQKQVDFVSFHL